LVRRANAVGDDLARHLHDVQVEKAVPEAGAPGKVRIARNKAGRARVAQVEVFYDHARLGHGLAPGFVAQHGDFARRPERQVRIARGGIAEVNDHRVERRAELIEGDQRLPAI
jgi:hypothetical protein